MFSNNINCLSSNKIKKCNILLISNITLLNYMIILYILNLIPMILMILIILNNKTKKIQRLLKIYLTSLEFSNCKRNRDKNSKLNLIFS